MAIEAHGAEIENRENNKLSFVVHAPDFRVRIRGFDNLRDVELRVAWKEHAE